MDEERLNEETANLCEKASLSVRELIDHMELYEEELQEMVDEDN